MSKDGYCPNRGCYFSEEPHGNHMCIECTLRYSDKLGDDEVFEIYYCSVEEFKNSNYFRTQIRSVDDDMNGDYDNDLEVFERKIFDIVNTILLDRQEA